MAEVLSLLNTAKYSQYLTNLSSKYRRLAELDQADLTRIDHQMAQWLLGAISGDSALQAAALAELAVIYDEDLIPPSSVIGSTPTALNTRVGIGVTLAAGSNTITFSSALSTTNYALSHPFAYTSNGGLIQFSVDPASRTVNGFTLVAASAGKLDYSAIAL